MCYFVLVNFPQMVGILLTVTSAMHRCRGRHIGPEEERWAATAAPELQTFCDHVRGLSSPALSQRSCPLLLPSHVFHLHTRKRSADMTLSTTAFFLSDMVDWVVTSDLFISF